MNLVNKDQLEILATLRESVNEDKTGLESEVKKLQDQIRDLKEKNKMQLEQVNKLLMEKVSLQSDGMTQREKMLERERNFTYVKPFRLQSNESTLIGFGSRSSDLRSSGNGSMGPEDRRTLLDMSNKVTALEVESAARQEKLIKARAVRSTPLSCVLNVGADICWSSSQASQRSRSYA